LSLNRLWCVTFADVSRTTSRGAHGDSPLLLIEPTLLDVGATCSDAGDKEFEVYAGNRVHVFRAPSVATKLLWVKALQTDVDGGISNVDLLAAADQMVRCCVPLHTAGRVSRVLCAPSKS